MNENKLLAYISEMNIVFFSHIKWKYLKFNCFLLAFFSENRILVLILTVFHALVCTISFFSKENQGHNF